MSKTDPRDSAFPRYLTAETQGLTKREIFSAMAMQGIVMGLGNQTVQVPVIDKHGYMATMRAPNPKEVAEFAVKHADALIAELSQHVTADKPSETN